MFGPNRSMDLELKTGPWPPRSSAKHHSCGLVQSNVTAQPVLCRLLGQLHSNTWSCSLTYGAWNWLTASLHHFVLVYVLYTNCDKLEKPEGCSWDIHRSYASFDLGMSTSHSQAFVKQRCPLSKFLLSLS